MKNSTNWNLYTTKTEKKPTQNTKPEIRNKNILKKLQLIEKAFR